MSVEEKMRATSGLPVGLSVLVLLATLGEGGGAAASLMIWHGVLVLILAAAMFGPRVEQDVVFGLDRRLIVAAALFLTTVVLGALRAPYAYAALLVLIELVAFLAVMLLAGRVGPGLPAMLVWPVRIAAAALGALALIQRVTLADPRPAATFLNTNHMAAWLVAALLLSTGAQLQQRRISWPAVALALPAAAALLLSGSRGAMLGLAAGIAVLAVLHARRLPLRALLASAAAVLVVLVLFSWRQFQRLGDEDPFRYQRMKIWNASIGLAVADPWWGTGPGQFPAAALNARFPDGDGPLRYDRTFSASHSDLLRLPAEFGVPATLIALASAMWAASRLARLRERRAEHWPDCGDGALAALAAIATHGLVDNPSRWSSVYVLAGCLAGSLLAMPRPRPRLHPAARAALAAGAIFAWVTVDLVPGLVWLEASRLPPGALDASQQARLDRGLERNPIHPDLWRRRAEHLTAGSVFELSTYVDARNAAEQAIRLQPADARYRRSLARVEARACRGLFRDDACRARTAAAFRDASARSRFDPMIPLELATFLLDTGDVAGGRRAAERALALEPRSALPRQVLAAAFIAAGEPARGARLLDEARSIDGEWAVRLRQPYAQRLMRADPEIESRLRREIAEAARGAGRVEAVGQDGDR